MKKVFILSSFFALFAWGQAIGQIGVAVGVGSCNSITITDPGVNPSPRTTSGPLVFVRSGRFYDDFCGYIAFDYIDVSKRIFTLFEVVDPTNPDRFNNLSYVTQNNSGFFPNLYVGTFIVDVFDASEEHNSICFTQGFPAGQTVVSPFKVFDILGRFVGFEARGGIFSGLEGSHRRTNDIIVGQSRLVDNDWLFTERFSTSRFGNLPVFQPTDIVRIDATKSKNYNKHYLAIQEFWPDGTQGRWRAKEFGGYGGWINGSMGTENLSDIWDGGTGWGFLENNKYQVQVVIQNSNCPSWTQVLQNFIVCSTLCRVGGESNPREISISPNPVSNKFNINGIDFNVEKDYQVLISDMSGKILKHFEQVTNNEFDVASMQNGIYIIQVRNKNQRLLSSKLVINK